MWRRGGNAQPLEGVFLAARLTLTALSQSGHPPFIDLRCALRKTRRTKNETAANDRQKSTQGAEEQTGIPAELDSALRMASAIFSHGFWFGDSLVLAPFVFGVLIGNPAH